MEPLRASRLSRRKEGWVSGPLRTSPSSSHSLEHPGGRELKGNSVRPTELHPGSLFPWGTEVPQAIYTHVLRVQQPPQVPASTPCAPRLPLPEPWHRRPPARSRPLQPRFSSCPMDLTSRSAVLHALNRTSRPGVQSGQELCVRDRSRQAWGLGVPAVQHQRDQVTMGHCQAQAPGVAGLGETPAPLTTKLSLPTISLAGCP